MNSPIVMDMRRHPVLWLVLAAAAVCYPFVASLSDNEISAVSHALLVVDVYAPGDVSLARLVADMEVWRWFTPALIHFSLMHIGFNGLLLVLFGRPVEAGIGHVGFAVLTLWVALVSNAVQVLFNESPFFGGLSGVVYGLIGYVAVMQRLQPASPLWFMPPGLIPSLLVFLVLFSTGITELFGLHIANAAHWGGLGAGVLAGLVVGFAWQRR